MLRKWKVCTDGGCPANPGPGAYAFVLEKGEGWGTFEKSGFLPTATNNQAEYRAITAAFIFLAEQLSRPHGCPVPDLIEIFSDSQLIVNQLNGRNRVLDETLKPFYIEARDCLHTLRTLLPSNSVTINWFRREHNTVADELCNKVLERRGIVIVSKKKKTSPKLAALSQ